MWVRHNKPESASTAARSRRRALLPRAVLLGLSHLSRFWPVRKNLLDFEQKFAILSTSKTADGLPQPTHSYSGRAHSSNGQALVRVHEYELQ